MAMPTDGVNKYRDQWRRSLIDYLEIEARNLRPDIWETYADATTYKGGYGHSPESSDNYPKSGVLTDNNRMVRIIGTLLLVPFTTNYATTKTAIQTAVGLL